MGLLEEINTRAGYMSRDDQSAKEVKLVRKYIDKHGVKRHAGIRDQLRKSQILFGMFQSQSYVIFNRGSILCQNLECKCGVPRKKTEDSQFVLWLGHVSMGRSNTKFPSCI